MKNTENGSNENMQEDNTTILYTCCPADVGLGSLLVFLFSSVHLSSCLFSFFPSFCTFTSPALIKRFFSRNYFLVVFIVLGGFINQLSNGKCFEMIATHSYSPSNIGSITLQGFKSNIYTTPFFVELHDLHKTMVKLYRQHS